MTQIIEIMIFAIIEQPYYKCLLITFLLTWSSVVMKCIYGPCALYYLLICLHMIEWKAFVPVKGSRLE